jgi:hypothetical protein
VSVSPVEDASDRVTDGHLPQAAELATTDEVLAALEAASMGRRF